MYNSNINLNLYKMFYDVAKYGSVSTAAKSLNISQPAISRAIKRLEEDLNISLFYRTLNGMILTEKGEELLKFVEDACNSLIIGERTILENDSLEKGKLVIGFSNSLDTSFLSKALISFHQAYPNIEISTISRSDEELLKLLEHYEVDFLIVDSPVESREKDLHIDNLQQNNYDFVTKSDTNIKIDTLKDLENYLVILPSEQSRKRQKLDKLLKENNIDLKNIISTSNSDLIKELLKESNSIGCIRLDSIKEELSLGNLKKLNFENELPYDTIKLIYVDKHITKATEVFITTFLKK